MKIWIGLLIPAAFLAGLTAGRWNPAPPQAPGARSESAIASPSPRSAASLAPVTGMLRIPDRVERTESDPEDADAAGEETATREAQTPPARTPRQAQADRQTLAERIEWAAEAWRFRADIARDTFLADAGMSRNEAVQFDVLMHAMNLRIEDTIDQWTDGVALRNTVRPEDSVRLLNEITEALVLTYDEMDRTLPPRWREAAGERFDLVTFIDPSVARPLIDVEEQLERAGMDRPRRGRRR